MEADYIALSQALQQVIPKMQLMKELESIVLFYDPTPQVSRKIFKDTISCIAFAKSVRLTPPTKHMVIQYHPFWEYTKSGNVKIYRKGQYY
jgi:hypothetical protein